MIDIILWSIIVLIQYGHVQQVAQDYFTDAALDDIVARHDRRTQVTQQ
jgi:hypothetical protein